MSIPNQLSMEALLAEKDLDVGAGLPESLRRDRERLKAMKQQKELARVKQERVEQLLASISEHQTRLIALQDELREAIHEFTALTIDGPAA